MLPTNNAPEYYVQLLSQKNPVKYRPYLVKEEKLLLMAQQSENEKDVEAAVKQIVRNCTFNSLNVDALPSFDLCFLFLQLRARSINNLIEVRFICQNKVDEKTCGALVPINVNIDDIKLTVPENHDKKVWISETLGLVMKYPTADLHDILINDGMLVDVLPRCIEQIFTKEGDVYEMNDASPKDVTTFVESLTVSQVEKIREFFDTMPTLQHDVEFKCPTCSYTETMTLKGLQDFFD